MADYNFLKSNKVCIVGGSIGRDAARAYIGTDWDVWCVARIYDFIPYATLVFEMHRQSQHWTHRTFAAYNDGKLIVQTPTEEFPGARILPVDELTKQTSALTSSFSWMIAYAMYCGATEIALCGVNMIHESELELQRPGLFYALGDARAHGIKLVLPHDSPLQGTDINFSDSTDYTLNTSTAEDQMKKVVIIGAGAGFELIRNYEDNREYEIWCVPTIYPVLQSHRIDKVFEVHPQIKWKPGIDYAGLGAKLMLASPSPAAPQATPFAIGSLQAKYGLVFSSSIAWMVGYALASKASEIVFLGVDMDNSYSGQRDGLFFLLGFAKAAKVDIIIPDSSKLNIFGKSYGWV